MPPPFLPPPGPEYRDAWRFQTDDEKLKSFNRWFKQQVEQGVFTTDAQGQPWTAEFVMAAYRKGLVDAFIKTTRGQMRDKTTDFLTGSKEQFLKSAFRQPERLSKARLLATRTFEELEDVTSTMANKMGRILSRGILEGRSPRELARQMTQEIDTLTRTRALTIARTEIIHAHAEGSLDAMEDLGVSEVGADVEWSTTEDDKVCPLCESLQGAVFSIEDARGLIPRHPNCRCSWIPVTEGLAEQLDRSGFQVAAKSALKDSIKAERPSVAFRQAKAGSAWLGKELL
jgi:SPP1 gp7 family putative phage head morphogenesis protein